jgi:hypothetical protein
MTTDQPSEIPAELTEEQKAKAAEDAERFYELGEPITVGSRQITRLQVDSRELSGKKFFEVLALFNRRYPRLAALSLNKYDSEEYLSLVLAELNEITPEDLSKLSFTELPLLFMRARSFLYAGGRKR